MLLQPVDKYVLAAKAIYGIKTPHVIKLVLEG